MENSLDSVDTSPEMFQGELYNAATDIYSLGILLFEMVVGNNPLLQFGRLLVKVFSDFVFPQAFSPLLR